ncbi:MAG: TylF/MycF/NovP-related O-methyltransferase [Elusimicrobiota bacterium]
MRHFLARILCSLKSARMGYASPLEKNLNIGERLGYEMEDEATEYIRLVKRNTMLSKRRLVTLYQQAVYCEEFEIPGSFVECGVWKGGAMGIMALANLRKGRTRRRLHLFDAFQDICEPDAAVDGNRAVQEVGRVASRARRDQGKLEPVVGFYDEFGGPGTLEENRRLLEQEIRYPADHIFYHVGWFQHTIPAERDGIGPIAILRLDGDWYASTKVCLENLCDKVVPGGVVIIDDYGTYDGCKRAVDEYLREKKVPIYLAPIDSDCRFFVKH